MRTDRYLLFTCVGYNFWLHPAPPLWTAVLAQASEWVSYKKYWRLLLAHKSIPANSDSLATFRITLGVHPLVADTNRTVLWRHLTMKRINSCKYSDLTVHRTAVTYVCGRFILSKGVQIPHAQCSRYNAVNFFHKYSLKTPHSLPARARYEVSFVDPACDCYFVSVPVTFM